MEVLKYLDEFLIVIVLIRAHSEFNSSNFFDDLFQLIKPLDTLILYLFLEI
jgi:hypothetical protein